MKHDARINSLLNSLNPFIFFLSQSSFQQSALMAMLNSPASEQNIIFCRRSDVYLDSLNECGFCLKSKQLELISSIGHKELTVPHAYLLKLITNENW